MKMWLVPCTKTAFDDMRALSVKGYTLLALEQFGIEQFVLEPHGEVVLAYDPQHRCPLGRTIQFDSNNVDATQLFGPDIS